MADAQSAYHQIESVCQSCLEFLEPLPAHEEHVCNWHQAKNDADKQGGDNASGSQVDQIGRNCQTCHREKDESAHCPLEVCLPDYSLNGRLKIHLGELAVKPRT